MIFQYDFTKKENKGGDWPGNNHVDNRLGKPIPLSAII